MHIRISHRIHTQIICMFPVFMEGWQKGVAVCYKGVSSEAIVGRRMFANVTNSYLYKRIPWLLNVSVTCLENPVRVWILWVKTAWLVSLSLHRDQSRWEVLVLSRELEIWIKFRKIGFVGVIVGMYITWEERVNERPDGSRSSPAVNHLVLSPSSINTKKSIPTKIMSARPASLPWFFIFMWQYKC